MDDDTPDTGPATRDALHVRLDRLEARLDAAVEGIGRIETAAAGLVAFADDLHARLKPMLEAGPFAALARMAGNGRG